MDFIEEEEGGIQGLPAWMGTFADLMSLLMCFFVLLLSFSEMDAQKYKLVAGSMKNAFGIQREVNANQNPTGAAELLENLQQSSESPESPESSKVPEELKRQAMMEQITEMMAETQKTVDKLEEELQDEISAGYIEVESGFKEIVIRIKEKGSFDSGSANFQESFLPVMDTLREVLSEMAGQISVEGHTDDVDISTRQFPSNWALSSARALSVGHELLRSGLIDQNRFVIVGYADTKPFVSNDTVEGRASNRRVEIVIKQEVSDEVMDTLRELEEIDPDIIQTIETGGELPEL